MSHMSDDELRYERARNAGLVEPEEMEFWAVNEVDLSLWGTTPEGEVRCIADTLDQHQIPLLNDARNDPDLAGWTDLHLRVVPMSWERREAE